MIVGGVLAFGGLLRRLEFEARGSDTEAGRLLAEHLIAGFSTFGEQSNGMHMNRPWSRRVRCGHAGLRPKR